MRAAQGRWDQLQSEFPNARVEVSGKRGINALRYRGLRADEEFTHFEDKPSFDEVELVANRFLSDYVAGRLDRLDVVYTRFETMSRQTAVVETLLPLGSLAGDDAEPVVTTERRTKSGSMYDFVPSAASILEEVVPTSFKVKLFKCFLDSAVSEQIARMVAMKSATENAG